MNNILIVFIILIIILVVFVCNCKNNDNFKNNNNIDKIYVINLKKNKKRYNKFIEKAQEANVNVSRFDAVYGKELSKNHPDIMKYFIKNHNLNPGQIGCALSHIKIWEDAIRNNYKNIIVFEDDAIIPIDFWKRFNKAYNELPKDWDMLLLGGVKLGGIKYSKNLLVPDKRSCNWGTSSMLMNINFIKKIMKDIKINTPIDEYLKDNYYYNKNFKVFFVSKTINEIDYEFNSDIGVGVPDTNYPIKIYKK